MKLIEADAVYKILESCEIIKATIGNPLTDWEYGYNCGVERAESEIECAPTIDAIPISWINDWYDRYMYAEVGDLLNDWMEEVRQMKEYIVTEHTDYPYEEPKPQELIRCKDCKYFKRRSIYHHGLCDVHCNGIGEEEVTSEDQFCSWAEKREEE